jgi:exopolysaccharide biosynthesis polyprenyl glycosylphosphotransferase
VSAAFGSLVSGQAGEVPTRRAGARNRLVRRSLVFADVIGLSAAFLTAEALSPPEPAAGAVGAGKEVLVFLATLPLWIAVAHFYGIYGRDEQRANHSTADDVVGVFHLVTIGSWLFVAGTWFSGLADPDLARITIFWLLAIVLVVAARGAARAICHRARGYVQRAVVIGAGDVGQLVGRKIQQHPEYGIELVGFVDSEPRACRSDLTKLDVLGAPEELSRIVAEQRVDRVIVAFSKAPHAYSIEQIRRLRDLDVLVDVVPRLFEALDPEFEAHDVEGLPLLGLAPVKRTRCNRLAKRTIDVLGAATLLVVTAPLFAYVAWRVKRESPGPVFFRQVRLGMHMRSFTALKFRSMQVHADEAPHREYIRATLSESVDRAENGLFKLDRSDAMTPFGRWLRRTSLDELPQLVNVLRGDMSLVGPRPCIPYEVENFAPHHFERFRVPAGMTGLWQVTARAHASFAEALELDVRYARANSLRLDLLLLLRTPVEVLRHRRGTS